MNAKLAMSINAAPFFKSEFSILSSRLSHGRALTYILWSKIYHSAYDRRARANKLKIAVSCPLWVISGHMQCKTACPLYPQKRTCAVQLGMSALGQKQTSVRAGRRASKSEDARKVLAWCVSRLPWPECAG